MPAIFSAPCHPPHLPSTSQPSVLIVDASPDNREVLRTVLARRGLTIFEADAAEAGSGVGPRRIAPT